MNKQRQNLKKIDTAELRRKIREKCLSRVRKHRKALLDKRRQQNNVTDELKTIFFEVKCKLKSVNKKI